MYILRVSYGAKLIARVPFATIGQAIRIGRWICQDDPRAWFSTLTPLVIGNRDYADILVNRAWRRIV